MKEYIFSYLYTLGYISLPVQFFFYKLSLHAWNIELMHEC